MSDFTLCWLKLWLFAGLVALFFAGDLVYLLAGCFVVLAWIGISLFDLWVVI